MKKEKRVGICMSFVWELYGLFGDLCGVLLLIFQTEKCYSVGMRKEALRERKQTGRKGESDMKKLLTKTTDVTFVDLFLTFTYPLCDLLLPFVTPCFRKTVWYKGREPFGRDKNQSIIYLRFEAAVG